MAKFAPIVSQPVAVKEFRPLEALDTSILASAEATNRGIREGVGGLIDITVEHLDENVRQKTKDQLQISEVATQTLASRKSSDRLGTLPTVGKDSELTPEELRDSRIENLIRDKFGTDVTDEIVKRTRKRFDLLAAAHAKGGLNRDDLGVIINSDLKTLIAQNPAFEDVIIDTAKTSLKFDPTTSGLSQALAALKPATESKSPAQVAIDDLARFRFGGDVDLAANHWSTLQQAKLIEAESQLKGAGITATIADHQRYSSVNQVLLGDIMQTEFETNRAAGIDSSTPEKIAQYQKFVRQWYTRAIQDLNEMGARSSVDNTSVIADMRDQETRLLTSIGENSATDTLTARSEYAKAAFQSGIDSSVRMHTAQQLYGNEYVATYMERFNAVKDDPAALAVAEDNFPQFRRTNAIVAQMEGFMDSQSRINNNVPASGDPADQKADIGNTSMVIKGSTTEDTASIQNMKYVQAEWGISSLIKSMTNTNYSEVKGNGKEGTLKMGTAAIVQEGDNLRSLLKAITPRLERSPVIISKVAGSNKIKVEPNKGFKAKPNLGGPNAPINLGVAQMKAQMDDYVIKVNNLLQASNSWDDGTGNTALVAETFLPKSNDVTPENLF